MRVNWDPSNIAADQAETLERRTSTSKRALKEASEQFEALFLNQLLTEMRRTVPENELFGDQKAEKLFQSMLDQEISSNSARGQSMGLAKLIYDQMSRYVSDDD
ncbi:MAG: rod-binding protein [Bacillota bacterium]|nr:rod-binding protein [Bacillota bacterium]HHU60469.1 hypothetical protein [Natronincola sp.]